MLYFMMTASFKDVVETDKVTLNISIWIGDTVTNTCLGCEVYDNRDFVFGEDLFYSFFISDRSMNKSPVTTQSLYFFQTFILDVDIVVIGDGINTDYFDVLYIVEKTLYEVATDKASGTCHEDSLAFEIYIIIYHIDPLLSPLKGEDPEGYGY